MRSRGSRNAFIALSAAAIVAAAALMPAHAGSKKQINTLMLNMGVQPNATGMVHFVRNKAQVAFQIKVSHLSRSAMYDVLVNGAVVDQIRTNAEGNGKVAHRSKLQGRKGRTPLPYDPRGATVEVARGGTVVLHADVPLTPGESHTLIVIEYGLPNAGVVPLAHAEAVFKSRDGRMRFKVEAEGLPEGTYDLRVGGVDVGDIVVRIDDDEDDECTLATDGEIVFDSMPQACHDGDEGDDDHDDDGDDDDEGDDDHDGDGDGGHRESENGDECGSLDQLLTFDPRGQSIEITQTDASSVVTVFFTGTFPTGL